MEKGKTDWNHLDTMTDEEINFSDCPKITPEQFANAVVRYGLPVSKNKAQVTLRVDSDVWNGLSLRDEAFKL